MRRSLIVALRALAPPAAVYITAVALAPRRAALITHITLVVVAGSVLAVLAVALARSLRPAGPSAFELGLRHVPRLPSRARQLERLEREVALGRQNAWDLHIRLRPTLRETAAGRLADRRGVDLEREPVRAAALLGEDAWVLVRPGHVAPEHRHDPGVTAAALDRAITALERL